MAIVSTQKELDISSFIHASAEQDVLKESRLLLNALVIICVDVAQFTTYYVYSSPASC